ncbi:(Fe-S)-binding protein, partial [Burkholderia mallei]|nr:(Fe-S)-binding protein [Burkholderia mallei]
AKPAPVSAGDALAHGQPNLAALAKRIRSE